MTQFSMLHIDGNPRHRNPPGPGDADSRKPARLHEALGAAVGRLLQVRPGTLLLLAVMLCVGAPAAADFKLTAPDGRRVLLKDDFTWSYLDEADENAPHVVFSVVSRKVLQSSCSFRVELTNNLGTLVRSIVPQVSAITKKGTVYDTVFVGFAFVKPTRVQSKEIIFSGLPCSRIDRLKVHGGDRCNMADLTPSSANSGECLAKVRVAKSDVVRVSK